MYFTLLAFVITLIIGLVCHHHCNGIMNQSVKHSKECDNKLRLLQKDLDEAVSMIRSYQAENQDLRDRIEMLDKKVRFYTEIEQDSRFLNLPESPATDIEEPQESDSTTISPTQSTVTDTPVATLDPEQFAAFQIMIESNRNLFISGKAGTGKSFLLEEFKKATRKRYIVLAPTGIAALNVGGVTLHSTFGFHNLQSNIEDLSESFIRLKSEKQKILRMVDTIIIDEISMVRADTLDKIDRILQIVNRTDKAFGGKQLLIFGDPFQLPPVANKVEREFLQNRYGGLHFFHSHAYKNGDFAFIELSCNHRQMGDQDFFELLNRVRSGSIITNDIELLNSRIVSALTEYDRFTMLLPTKDAVERVNTAALNRITDSQAFEYPAIVTYDKYPDKTKDLEKTFPINMNLKLKIGVLVMMVSNDPNGRWVNGSLGIVKTLTSNSIFVAIDGQSHQIFPETFKSQEASIDHNRIVYEDILCVQQYPLVLAYAITIHKSQGKTYTNILCDISKCFERGQAYVALSRCRSLNGLHLVNPVHIESFTVDSDVQDFIAAQQPIT